MRRTIGPGWSESSDFNARQYALQAAYYQQAKTMGFRRSPISTGETLAGWRFPHCGLPAHADGTTKAKTGVDDEKAASGLTVASATTKPGPASDFYRTAEVVQRVIEFILPYRTWLRK